MAWLPLALLSTFMMTAINFGDKFIVERAVPDARAVPGYMALTSAVFGLALWLLLGAGVDLPPLDGFAIVLGGFITLFGVYFYMRAMSAEEASRIIVFTQTQPILILILSALFLGERLNAQQLVGFALILAAAIGASLVRSAQVGEIKRPASFAGLINVFVAGLFWSSAVVLQAGAINRMDLSLQGLAIVSALNSMGYSIGGVALYLAVPHLRRVFVQRWQISGPRPLLMISIIEGAFVLRQVVFYAALAAGPAALIAVVGSTNVFFGIGMGWALMRLAPATFKEDVSRRGMLTKLGWAGVVFAGVVLVG